MSTPDQDATSSDGEQSTVRLPQMLIPDGDPDRFATNWDDVKVATPGPATDTAKDPAAAEAEIDPLVMTWNPSKTWTRQNFPAQGSATERTRAPQER